ncbi:hypothetical protein [uncultured Algimonas sp.]|uniref:hypothetical protein n=1 Tax=uncultured Algimonas sp. TaxID=1547920 RepID=UPI00261C76B2|nr:hypothetical protein [uncultured Algimonas sp.]
MARTDGQIAAGNGRLRREKADERDDLSRLNAVRLIVVALIGLGYASTMPVGPGAREWLNLFGYDPSLFGLQVLFFLSGWLAWRSLASGRSLLEFTASRARRILPWVALYTLIVVALLYPALCDHGAAGRKDTVGLLRYFIETVTLIRPGQPMPGALDEARYGCLLQGTIWTLRWGALAYAGLLVLHALGARHWDWYAGLLVAGVAAHIGVDGWTDRTGSDLLGPAIPGLRLAVAFLLGVLVRQFRFAPLLRGRAWAVVSAICLGAAYLHFHVLPWSRAIELLAMSGWCALAMAVLQARGAWLRGWPDIVLPAYLGVWPLAQLILALRPDISVAALVVATLAAAFGTAFLFSRLARVRLLHRRVQPA